MDREKKQVGKCLLWRGFYQKTLRERQAQIKLCFPSLFPTTDTRFPLDAPLDPMLADSLVENCIGTLGLPLGLGVNLSVNNQHCLVPIATEEPRQVYMGVN
jgi:hydroxymethylglutaryl-CoA reductase